MSFEKLVRNVGYPTFEGCPMKAIDRVMAAYARVHKLTDEQAAMARKELSRFIDQLLAGRMPGSPDNQTRTPSDSN
jgi:hypothetical protein